MTQVRSSSVSKLLTGYFAAFCSIVSSMFSASCVQALRGSIPDFQLSAIRAAVQGLTFFVGGLIVSTDFIVKLEYVPRLIYASTAYFLYNVGFFAGATYVPLGDLEGVVVIAGIAFAVAQSKLLFSSEIPKSIIIAAIVCIPGIVLTIQPSWLFKQILITENTVATGLQNKSTTHQSPVVSSDAYDIMVGYLFGILGGAGQGIMGDANGVLLKDVKIIPKATYAMLGCTIASVAFMFYFEDPVFTIGFVQFEYILGHSLLSAVGAFAAVYAASIIPGPTLAIMWCFEVVTMLVSQYTIMRYVKPGNNNWIEVVGCFIIVFGASIPGVVDILAQRTKAKELP